MRALRPAFASRVPTVGLVVCFVTFGAFMMLAPFVADDDDRIAQLCQLQVFCALLAAVMLKYTPQELAGATGVDFLLTFLTIAPIVLTFYLETEFLAPSKLAEHWKAFRRWSGFMPPPPEEYQPTVPEEVSQESAADGEASEGQDTAGSEAPPVDEPALVEPGGSASHAPAEEMPEEAGDLSHLAIRTATVTDVNLTSVVAREVTVSITLPTEE